MLKPRFETTNATVDTVGELIELLKQMPSDYQVSLSGISDCQILIDNSDNYVLIDEKAYIEALINGYEEEDS